MVLYLLHASFDYMSDVIVGAVRAFYVEDAKYLSLVMVASRIVYNDMHKVQRTVHRHGNLLCVLRNAGDKMFVV